MSADVDPAVILAAQKGDMGAFEEIVRFYQKVVLAVAYYITGSRDDAEDICQDAFLKFYRYMHSFMPHRGSLKSYLYKLVANQSYQHLAKHQNRGRLETAIETLPVDSLGTEDVPFSGGVEVVEKLLEQLTSRERGIFVMHEVAEMDYDEIAVALKISPVTARRFHSMARQKLQALITRDYPEYKESE
jgi:RNA polymerase sigma-70 factor (ECF subfamily)